VPLHYTSTALTLALEKQGRSPVILLDKLAGREGRMAANLFGSRERMARGIGATPDTFLAKLGYALDHLVPAETVACGPVHDIVWEGPDADLNRLPIPGISSRMPARISPRAWWLPGIPTRAPATWPMPGCR
jgi:3-polyprenyl-4-hydroxybenzoate decarboxylase